MSSTNVHGRNYGTHIDGAKGRTLCKRYAVVDVNRIGRGEDGLRATCKLCKRAHLRAIDGGKE